MSAGSEAVVGKLTELLSVSRLMEKHLDKMQKGGGAGEKGGDAGAGAGGPDPKQMSSLASSFKELIEAAGNAKGVDKKKAQNVVEFYDVLSSGITKVVKDMDADKINAFAELMTVMVEGTAEYMKSMALSAIFGPFALIGAYFFAQSLNIIMAILENVATLQESQQKSLMFLVGGSGTSGEGAKETEEGGSSGGLIGNVKSFMIGMALSALLGPFALIGAIFFGLIILAIGSALALVGNMTKGNDKDSPLTSLLTMGRSIAIFMLVMIGIALLSPLVMAGVFAFSLAIVTLSLGLMVADRIAGRGAFDSGPIGSLMKMARGIALFMLVMIAISFVRPQVAIGVLTFAGAIIVLSGVLFVVDKIAGGLAPFDSGPLGSLMKMARGIAIFMLAMVGIAMLRSQIAIGVLVFSGAIIFLSGTLRLVEKIAGAGGLKGAADIMSDGGAIGSLMKMAKGIFLFSLTMVLISYFVPQFAIGVLAFSGAIILLAGAMKIVEKIAGKGGLKQAASIMSDTGAIGSLMKMAKGIFLFSLTMVLISYFVPQFAIGVLAFIGALILLTGAMKLMDIIINSGKSGKGAAKRMKDMMGEGGPIGSLMKMGWGILLFSAVMVGVGYFAKQFTIGATVVSVALTAIGLIMLTIYGNAKVKDAGKNLLWIAAGLTAFSLAFGVMAFVLDTFNVDMNRVGIFAAIIVGMGLIATVLGMPPVDSWAKAGAINLILIGGALAVFSIGLAIFAAAAKNLTWEQLGMMGAVIGVMALIGTVLGIPAVAPFALIGAAVLIALGAAFLVFTIGFTVFAAAMQLFPDNESILRAGLAIVTIGGAFAILGPIMPFIILGSAAMVVAAVALLPISISLAIWKAAGIADSSDDVADSLSSVLPALGWAMAGRSSAPDGLIETAKAAVGTAAFAAAVIVGSYAMMIAGAALIPISIGLGIFKRVAWKAEDSESLTYMLSAMGDAFANLARGGKWYLVQLGIMATMYMGNNLSSLAKGIQDLSNMTFTEYEWDDTTKKLEPKKKVKLTTPDVKVAADNAAMMISTMVKPLSEFGMLFSGSIGGSDLYPGLSPFGAMMGILMLGDLGKNLGALAQGTQAWANMSYWEYSLQMNPKTGMNELRPSAKKKLSPSDITEAAANISSVIRSMVDPIAEFGMLFSGTIGSAILYPGLTPTGATSGIKALGSLGGSLASLAKGVSDWAKLGYWEYELQMNSQTGMKELKPSKFNKLSKTQLTETGNNIASVIAALTKPVVDWGIIMTAGNIAGGPFVALGLSDAKNPVEKGIAAMGALGISIRQMAEGVKMFANLEFMENEIVKDPETGLNKIQPGKITKLTPAQMTNAVNNIAKLFRTSVAAIIDADGMVYQGTYTAWSNNGEEFVYDYGWDNLLQSTQGLNKWIPEFAKTAPSMQKLIASVTGIDPAVGMMGISLMDMLLFKAVKSMIDIDGAVYQGTLSAYSNNGTEVSFDGGWEGLTTTTQDLQKWLLSYARVVGTIDGIFGDVAGFQKTAKGVKIFTNDVVRRIANPGELVLFGRALQQMDKHLTQLGTLATRYLMLNVALQPALVQKYDKFAKITERLAKISTPFQSFVKSFGDMATHMGTFAKNFKIMTPEGIKAYETWSNTVVTVAKTDMSQIRANIDAMRDLAASVVGGQQAEVPATDNGQTSGDKVKFVKETNAGTNRPATGSLAGPPAGAAGNGMPTSIGTLSVGTLLVTTYSGAGPKTG